MSDPKKTCPYCEGSGVIYTDDDRDTCPNCWGEGYIYQEEPKNQHQVILPYILTRDVTRKECPWLKQDMKERDQVWPYIKHTYGCISNTGTAVSHQFNQDPFFELPSDALREAELHEAD